MDSRSGIIVNIKDHRCRFAPKSQLLAFPWRKLLLQFWTQFSELPGRLHWPRSVPGRGSPPSYRSDTRNIWTSWVAFLCSHESVQRRHLHKRVRQMVFAGTGGPSCHLYRLILTIVSFASISKSWDLLPVGNHRLEDLFRVQVAFGEGMLESYDITTSEIVIFFNFYLQYVLTVSSSASFMVHREL